MDRRKAGDFLTGLLGKAREVDDAYSARIGKMYEGSNPAVRTAAYTVGGAHPSLRKAEPDYRDGASKLEQAIGNAAVYAIPAANAVPKYVLPAAGVTLAGKGLMDMAASFGGPADQQEPGQISLGQSAGVALVSGGSVALGMEVSEASREPLTQASISPRNRAAIAIGTGLGGGLVNAAGQAVLQ